ncbi:PREDICTED: techylectin-5A-like [Priapulus caudatus]|uniref:Techylectin-5A-like n=1 Tax=Priapulus caudatus TaxID=37621 RepID=A0ABM1F6F2_PRICU|nr:PREDICTED: techylectin-5A-like [Priapulus caudatus]
MTVFQRRLDGSECFYRNWDLYKFGFGNINGEHWLGNDRLSALTTPVPMQLRIDLRRFSGETRYATYDVFSIASERALYKLNVGMYHGTADDSMISAHHGKNFSTPDRDNDTHKTGSCAESHKGGWWYGFCHHSNLNGLYGEDNTKGVVWYTWPGHSEALMSSEMKVRPVQYALH